MMNLKQMTTWRKLMFTFILIVVPLRLMMSQWETLKTYSNQMIGRQTSGEGPNSKKKSSQVGGTVLKNTSRDDWASINQRLTTSLVGNSKSPPPKSSDSNSSKVHGAEPPNTASFVTSELYLKASQLQLPTDQLLTACEANAPFRFSKIADFVVDGSPEICRSLCYVQGRNFAAVYRGSCFCGNVPTHAQLVDLEACDYQCDSKDADGKPCNTDTKPHALSMRTRVQDGAKEWTPWMALTPKSISVRYRSCHLTSSGDCVAEFEKQIQMRREPLDQAKLFSSFLGCYSGVWITIGECPDSADCQIVFSTKYSLAPRIFVACRDWCSSKSKSSALYAALGPITRASRNCYCITSLYSAKPTNTCNQGLGYFVFETEHLAKANLSLVQSLGDSKAVRVSHRLKFYHAGTEPTKVLIIARYRSGSSMTQSFFTNNRRALSIFEYGRMKSNKFPSDNATLRALEALFQCDIARMPASLYSGKFPRWSSGMLRTRAATQNNLQFINSCSKGLMRDCSAYLHEVCQISEFIDVKLIRVENPKLVSEFITRNPNVKVVHLVRDPRGLKSAEVRFGRRRKPQEVCQDLLNMGAMFHQMVANGSKNAFEVHYEQLAMNATYYGQKLYQQLGIEKNWEEVKNFLSHEHYKKEDGKRGMKIPRNAQNVVKVDPESHVYNFLNRHRITKLLKMDELSACRQVYQTWPIYQPTKLMYRTQKSKVLKYSSSYNQQWIYRHQIVFQYSPH